jgi:hypothetical protein
MPSPENRDCRRIEPLQIDILVGQPVEPDRAEERIDRLDQQDGPGKAVVVKIDP